MPDRKSSSIRDYIRKSEDAGAEALLLLIAAISGIALAAVIVFS
jgi:hypothetical protein